MNQVIDYIVAILGGGEQAKPVLREALVSFGESKPDFADIVNELVAKLDAAAPPEAETLVGELKAVLATKTLNPRQHPSDLA